MEDHGLESMYVLNEVLIKRLVSSDVVRLIIVGCIVDGDFCCLLASSAL